MKKCNYLNGLVVIPLNQRQTKKRIDLISSSIRSSNSQYQGVPLDPDPFTSPMKNDMASRNEGLIEGSIAGGSYFS